MDLLIFCGQSNMQGQSDRLSDANIVPNAYEYKFLSDEVVPLKNPVGEDITFNHEKGYVFQKGSAPSDWWNTHCTGSACYGHTNMVPSFCKVYTEKTGREVLAVHVAKGNTEIAYWMPGGAGYDILIKKVNAAKKHLEPERILLVWHQGGKDMLLGHKKDYYKEKIVKLCEILKRELGIERFGIISYSRFAHDERDFEIINAHNEVCKENKDFLMLTDIALKLSEEPENLNPFVEDHFSAIGLEKLGAAAAETLANEYK